MKPLGDLIEVGEELDGATICDWCNGVFKGDGNLERCNECLIQNMDEKDILRLYFRRCDYCSKGASNIGVVGGCLYVCENCFTDWIIDEAITHTKDNNKSFLESDKKQDWILDVNDQIRSGYNIEDTWECELYSKNGARFNCHEISYKARKGKVIVITQYEEDDQIQDFVWHKHDECWGEYLNFGCCNA